MTSTILAIGALMVAGMFFAGALAGQVSPGGVLFAFGLSGTCVATAVFNVKVFTKRWPDEKRIDRALKILDTFEGTKVDPKYAAQLPAKSLTRALKLADRSGDKNKALLGIVETLVNAARGKSNLHKALEIANKIEDAATKVKALTCISVASIGLGLDVGMGNIDFPELDHKAFYFRDTAVAYASRGRYEKAIACVDVLAEGELSELQEKILAQALQGIVGELGKKEKLSSGEDDTSVLDSVLTRARAISSAPIKASILVGIARACAQVNPNKTREILEEAIPLVTQAEDLITIAQVYAPIDQERAKEVLVEAHLLASDDAIRSNIAVAYARVGFALEALAGAEKLKDLVQKGWAYCDIGQVLITLGDSHFQSALVAFQKSVRVVNLLSVKRGLHEDVGSRFLAAVSMLVQDGRLSDALKVAGKFTDLKSQKPQHIEALIKVAEGYAKTSLEDAKGILAQALGIAESLPSTEQFEAKMKVVEASISIGYADIALSSVERSSVNGVMKMNLVYDVFICLLNMMNTKIERPLQFYQDAYKTVNRMTALMPQIAEAHGTYQTRCAALTSQHSQLDDASSLEARLTSLAENLSQIHAEGQNYFPVFHAILLSLIARGHVTQEPKTATRIFKEALTAARLILDPKDKSDALQHIGFTYLGVNSVAAQAMIKQALEAVREITDPAERARELRKLGNAYRKIDLGLAKEIYLEAFEATKLITDPEKRADAQIRIGYHLYLHIEGKETNYPWSKHKALKEIFPEALESARKITDVEAQVTAFCDIGRFYALSDHKMADTVFQEVAKEAVFADAFGNTQHRDYIVERLLAEDPIDLAKLC